MAIDKTSDEPGPVPLENDMGSDEPGRAGSEANRLSGRMKRYAKVGGNMSGIAARVAGARLFGLELDRDKNAADLAAALGGLKGPLMKVAQLLSTIPDALPAEYAAELSQLQNQAPPMGWGFVRRRMAAELGANWQQKFASFSKTSAASASLGQVHKATSLDGKELACKLQYPDMESAVEADLNQLKMIFAIHKRMDPAIDTSEISDEIGARLREELNYELEARHTKLYAHIFANEEMIRVPQIHDALSTRRLLTMSWCEGKPLLDYVGHDEATRNHIARAMFKAWWTPFSHYGVIHGDPHLGNYTVFENESAEAGSTEAGSKVGGINLLDYGCIRTFPVSFVQGVIDLYHGLQKEDRDLIVHAYETWGFKGLSNELIDILNIWANFIYGPLLDDRERRIAEDISPSEYGRKQAFTVHQGLKENGPVKVPREFVFMDRAAIGLGGVFLHLNARLNYYQIFNETIADFDKDKVAARQSDIFTKLNIPHPQAGA